MTQDEKPSLSDPYLAMTEAGAAKAIRGDELEVHTADGRWTVVGMYQQTRVSSKADPEACLNCGHHPRERDPYGHGYASRTPPPRQDETVPPATHLITEQFFVLTLSKEQVGVDLRQKIDAACEKHSEQIKKAHSSAREASEARDTLATREGELEELRKVAQSRAENVKFHLNQSYLHEADNKELKKKVRKLNRDLGKIREAIADERIGKIVGDPEPEPDSEPA